MSRMTSSPRKCMFCFKTFIYSVSYMKHLDSKHAKAWKLVGETPIDLTNTVIFSAKAMKVFNEEAEAFIKTTPWSKR